MRTLIHKAVVTATLGALMLAGAFAQTQSVLPPVQKSGQVEYLSGGIGLDESSAIESASKQWPLTLEFAVKDRQRANFVSDVKVQVRDANGRTILQASTDGPFLLARLMPGRYTIEATLADKTLHQKVVVKRGQPTKSVLVWPAGADQSPAVAPPDAVPMPDDTDNTPKQ